MIKTASTKSVTTMHPGKRAPSVVNTLRVKIVMPQLRQPITKAHGDSVLGASQDFRTVGSAAT